MTQVPVVRVVPIVAVLSVVALVGLALTRAPPAIPRTPSSAGPTWGLVADSGWYVTAELGDTGSRYGMLRARSVEGRAWETFAILTIDSTGEDRTVVLRSRANGRYVSAEIRDRDDSYGMLRARARTIGPWEKFTLVSEGDHRFAVRSRANDRYVSADLGDTGDRFGMLRAQALRVGSREKFQLVELPSAAADSRVTAPFTRPFSASKETGEQERS